MRRYTAKRILRSKHFLAGSLIAVVLCFASQAMADVTLTASADTYISSTNPTINFGSATNLLVGGGNSVLLQFDLSSLSGQPLVTKALLSIWVTQVNTGGAVDFSDVTSSWNESTVTFDTQPTTGPPLASGVALNASGFYITVDVTLEVQQWQSSPITNNGVEISASVAQPATSAVFASRDNSNVNEPPILTLEGVTAVPEPSSLLLLGTGALGLVGPIRRKLLPRK